MRDFFKRLIFKIRWYFAPWSIGVDIETRGLDPGSKDQTTIVYAKRIGGVIYVDRIETIELKPLSEVIREASVEPPEH